MKRTINQFRNDVDKIRIKTYNEIKNLSDIELIEYFSKFESKIAKQYDFKFITTLDSDDNNSK
jgi:hypothetical protein